jgi:hypothetical protein
MFQNGITDILKRILVNLNIEYLSPTLEVGIPGAGGSIAGNRKSVPVGLLFPAGRFFWAKTIKQVGGYNI